MQTTKYRNNENLSETIAIDEVDFKDIIHIENILFLINELENKSKRY
jgi:hypothetical protein